MSGYSLRYEDWLRGWREWARTRKRGKMAQFIVEKLEEGNQAQWLDIERGLFELTEWHAIAREWFGEKPRNSEEVDAPCMLRKGLPRAFPGLAEIKEKSRKEGTQYRSRVFRAPQTLMNDVLLHITNNAGLYLQNGGSTDHVTYNAPTTFPSYPTTNHGSTAIPVASTVPTYFSGAVVGQDYINSPTATTLDSIQHQQHSNSQNSDYHHQMVNSQDGGHRYLNQQTSYTSEDIDMYVQRITDNGINGTTTGGAACYRPPSGSSSSYNCTPPASVGMLGVPSPGSGYHQVKEEMNSPPSSDPPAYGTSPASAHSLRISPEPSMMGPSYPPSVQQQAVMSGPEMSPVTHASTSPAIPVEPGE